MEEKTGIYDRQRRGNQISKIAKKRGRIPVYSDLWEKKDWKDNPPIGHIKTHICILEKWHIVRKYKMAIVNQMIITKFSAI